MWNKSLHNCHGLCFLSTALLVRLSEVTLQCLRKQTQCTDKIYEMLTFNYLSKNCNCKPLKRERRNLVCAPVCVRVRVCGMDRLDSNLRTRIKMFYHFTAGVLHDILVNVLLLPGTFNITHVCEIQKHLLLDYLFFFFFDFPVVDVNNKKTRNDYEYSMNDCKLKEVQMTYIHTTRKS